MRDLLIRAIFDATPKTIPLGTTIQYRRGDSSRSIAQMDDLSLYNAMDKARSGNAMDFITNDECYIGDLSVCVA